MGGQVGGGVKWVCCPSVCVCSQSVCGLSVCRGQVGGWWSGWVVKWVGGQSGWQYISDWRAWSTDSEYINFLAVGTLEAEILSHEFPNFGNFTRAWNCLYFPHAWNLSRLYLRFRSAHARAHAQTKKMAAPIDSKWRPPWSRSNSYRRRPSWNFGRISKIRKFGAPYLSP